jgi:hypothetical protein
MAGYVKNLRNADPTVLLPRRPRVFTRWARDRFFPGLRPRARWPADLVRGYHETARFRAWMVALLLLVALLALVAAAVRPSASAMRPKELGLLLGIAIGILLGTTATVDHAVRYLLPVLPPLVAAAALGVSGLLRSSTRDQAAQVEGSPASAARAKP